jgi:hypothetical protein
MLDLACRSAYDSEYVALADALGDPLGFSGACVLNG